MKEYTVLHLFGGLGGFAIGFKKAIEEYRGMVGRFRNLAGIDCVREACEDFRNLTGAPAAEIDLFTREDYIAFHGKEPPTGWREMTPGDLLEVAGEYPDVVALSPPCKGFSGLLPSAKAASEKYQALNNLVTRGLQLTVEAFADNLPAVIMIENVPRITSRGEFLLKQVKRLVGAHGYLFHEGFHDCGELGGLGQHRKRYLLIARLPEKMNSFIYRPPKRRVKSIGEVIGPMPMPDDRTAGPMHRLPRLKWLTWMRLALIPAGGDWRDLEKLAPEEYRLEYIPRGGGPFGVHEWRQPAGTVIGNASVKGSNAAAVADPRLGHEPREGVYKVQDWESASTTVVGSAKVGTSNGAACVADPRLSQRDGRHPAVYQVVKFDDSAPCVTGTRFGSGAPAVADPRMGLNKNAHNALCQMAKWEDPANTVTGATRPAGGAISVADPRLGCKSRPSLYGVADWERPISTVIGTASVSSSNGVAAVADPRMTCKARSGTMGVQAWDDPGKTVIGAGDIHACAAAVADPRIPDNNDRPDPPPVIIALDGTWHRPLTTLELAALQGFPLTMPDGRPLALAGKSDARHRERIGNAVPPPAARAIAEQILTALLVSEEEDGWVLGATGVWVNREEDLPWSSKIGPYVKSNT
jgi:site-specific DNA-cytosine methylase